MRKLFFFVLFFIITSQFLNADYLLLNFRRCASDYYYKSNRLYYLDSASNKWKSSTSKVGFIYSGYDYNSSNNECYLKPILNDLQLSNNDYNSYMAFAGLISAFLITYTSLMVLKV